MGIFVVTAAAVAVDAGEKKKSLFVADTYLQHVRHLASDELAGRAPGSEGADLAARYIIEQWKEAGCQPAGVDGTWFQPFDVRRGKRIVDGEARLEIGGMDRRWTVRRDWIPFPFTEMESIEAPLAFAGFGVSAEEHGYDDYAGFDAKGKALLIFRYEPKSKDPDAAFGGDDPSRNAYFVTKAQLAAKRGAKALLVVDPPSRNPDDNRLFTFNTYNSQQTFSLPMVHITRAMASAILDKAGMGDLAALQARLERERKSMSINLGMTVKLDPGVQTSKITARNVIGMIPGNTDETVVVGAHRDHLGVVPRQFQRKDMTPVVHNGADDNASGTAAIIEMAKAVGNSPKLRRNVLFIAFDGEEMGLLGSRHFVRHPTIPLESIRAMINFDMIGRLRLDKFTVFGVPTGKEFPALVDRYADLAGLEYKAPDKVSGNGDHAPFFKREIPAMFAFTGIHWDYHQPEDDWDRIDADGATRVMEMWYGILLELASMENGPTYVTPGKKGGLLPRIKDFLGGFDDDNEAKEPDDRPRPGRPADAESKDGDGLDDAPSRSQLKVRLGVVPDMVGDDEPGMVVETVLEDGPAGKAGMRDGDRIIRIGDETIRDIYGYMRSLQAFKPGDDVDVIVIRDGQEITLKVRLIQWTYKRNGE